MKLAIRLLKYINLVKWQFSLGIILLYITTFCMQFSPIIIQRIIDDVLTPVTKGQSLDTQQLMQYSIIFILLVIISSIVGYLSLRILSDSANKIAEHLRNQAYEVMQKLPISYFDDKPAGKIATRIINDTETLRSQFYGSTVSQLLFHIFIIIIIYMIIFALNIWLGLLMLVLLPVMFIWQKLYSKRAKDSLDAYYELQGVVNTHINETMNGSTILQLFKQEDRMITEFEDTTKKMYYAQQKLVTNDSFFSWTLMDLFKRIVVFAIIAIIGQQVLGGLTTLTTGVLFTILNYTERLFDSVGTFARFLPNIQRAMTTGSRVFELIDAQIEEDCDNELIIKNGNVSFKHVTFGYKDNQTVLKDINIEAKQGEVIALVGHTGSGKSSIINLLFRFYDAKDGIIEIDGQNIQQFNRESIRKDMGIVLQDPYLFTGTIASNISMDDDTITEDKIRQSLVDVGAEFMLTKYKDGIHEKVVEKGNTFSSGERQLISFARTLASDPKILILDEATSHVDTQTEEIIQNAMKVVQQGRTTFIVAHRLSTIQHADQILVLHEGAIVERGTHQELLALNQHYAQMYNTQAKIA